ncbi:MAG TPA: nitrile hydratase subunit alpha [Candidatus Acidoferrales bacterium]|nr:nitrile hydratase subunit alpha [Candidatus Acidoferrales bacterium]
MSHDDHGDHDHSDGDPIAKRNALRAEALESLLVERGLVRPALIDAIVARYEQDIGPLNGAKVVARAWSDDSFRQRLLSEAWTAIAELDLPIGAESTPIVVVENSPNVHHVVVCTLCSCYPSSLLGLPPTWYKSPQYRSRVVREPRAVLHEMGLDLPADVEVRVWDSSAEIRYMVLPERPQGTEGWTEEQLRTLVTRDSLIGVANAKSRDKGDG